jgi:hypothetical protein
MSISHYPSVVTDGMALYFDAASAMSYSGSGSSWNDLSGRGNHGTLVNGPIFDANTNKGAFTFDGTNDYVDFSVPGVGTILSIEMWVRAKSFVSNGMFLGFHIYDVWTGFGALGYNTGASDVYGLTSTQVANLGLLNQWKHYVFEMRSDVSYTNNKIYINGQNQSLSQVAGTENASLRNFNSGNGRIGSWRSSNNFYMSMDHSQFKVYNRALSAAEVANNYNAMRGRYI